MTQLARALGVFDGREKCDWHAAIYGYGFREIGHRTHCFINVGDGFESAQQLHGTFGGDIENGHCFETRSRQIFVNKNSIAIVFLTRSHDFFHVVEYCLDRVFARHSKEQVFTAIADAEFEGHLGMLGEEGLIATGTIEQHAPTGNPRNP
jgi:hypothetical protein